MKVLYNAILVITDRLSKYKYFILYKKSLTAEELVYMFLRVLAANYRILDKIISNRDKLFTFKVLKIINEPARSTLQVVNSVLFTDR